MKIKTILKLQKYGTRITKNLSKKMDEKNYFSICSVVLKFVTFLK